MIHNIRKVRAFIYTQNLSGGKMLYPFEEYCDEDGTPTAEGLAVFYGELVRAEKDKKNVSVMHSAEIIVGSGFDGEDFSFGSTLYEGDIIDVNFQQDGLPYYVRYRITFGGEDGQFLLVDCANPMKVTPIRVLLSPNVMVKLRGNIYENIDLVEESARSAIKRMF